MPAGAMAGLQVGGGLLSAFGSKKAAKEQAAAYQTAMQNQLAMFNEAKGYMTPYMDVGEDALVSLADLYGLGGRGGGAFNEKALDAFRKSPDYDWAMKEGTRALTFSNSARGLANTGHLRSLVDYGQDSASKYFGNYVGRLGQLAEMGRGTAMSAAQLLTGQANTMAAGQMRIGDIESAGTAGMFNALGGALGGLPGVFKTFGMPGGLKMPGSAYSGSLPLTPNGFVAGGV